MSQTHSGIDLSQIQGNQLSNYITSNTADDQAGGAISGRVEIAVTTADVDLTTGNRETPTSNLAKALYRYYYKFTGAMTANRNVIVPNNTKIYACEHACTGGFTITVKTAAGTGISLSPGDTKRLYCDGTNVINDPSSGAGAPSGAQYVVLATHAELTSERVLTAGSNLKKTDGGANGNVTLDALTENVALSGVISPSQITSDQNDYNPTGLSTASGLRLSSDASRNITGLQGGASGRIIFIHNVGSNPIVLVDESGSSSAANRFALTADLTLTSDSCIVLQYDSTSQRWRVVGGSSGPAIYDVAGTFIGQPDDGLIILIHPFAQQVVFPAGLTGSKGVLLTATTAQADLPIKKNGVQVGTMTYAAAATTATFTMASQTTFAIGDILTLVAPSPKDTTLAGIGFTLVGTRS